MRSFIVLMPPPNGDPSSDARSFAEVEKMRFLKEGFSFTAFLFFPFWALGKKLWLATLVYLIGMASIAALELNGVLIGNQAFFLGLGMHLICGFEARNWLKKKLQAQGWREAGIAVGRTMAEAERDFLRIYQPPRADNDLSGYLKQI